MPMRKQKDDTKQCTLSFGGGVLSPSAATLHDSKQPRITKMMVGDSGKASRHFLSHSAHAKEDAPDGLERQASGKQQDEPENDATNHPNPVLPVKEEEEGGSVEEHDAGAAEVAAGEDDVGREEEGDSESQAQHEGLPSKGSGGAEAKVPGKRKRLHQADSSDEEETGEGTTADEACGAAVGGASGNAVQLPQEDEEADPTDWRERTKAFVRHMPLKLVLAVLGRSMTKKARSSDSRNAWDPEAEGLTEGTMEKLQAFQYRAMLYSNYSSFL